MRDDAVAPVIAVMLILAAIVTILSIWNAVYVPSMKQAAEVSHLQNVESAFLHFSSDIGRAASTRQDDLFLSEPVQLGGGDFLFNTLRSSGSLAVQNEPKPAYYLWLDDHDDPDAVGTLVNISYEPVGNFWQDQGYRWQRGYLNVTKYHAKQAPLGYDTMTEVNNEFGGAGTLAAFAGSFGSVEYTVNQTPVQNETANEDNRFTFFPREGNCSRIDLWAVSLSASPDHPFVSSNGYGTLQLKSNVTTVPYYGVRNITLGSGRDPFGNATFGNWNASLASAARICNGNIRYNQDDYGDDFFMYTLRQEVSPVNVTLNLVTIEVGAY